MINETKIPIPARIHNAAVGGHVAGTDDIIDDALDREQSEINQEVVGEDATSIKNRLNSIEAVFETSGGDAEITSNPSDIVVSGGKIPTANAVRGAITAANGYFVCDSLGNTYMKNITVPGYIVSIGGSIKIKMTNKNTAETSAQNVVTLQINNFEAKPLYYDNEPVSATNTWEANEVIDVYYDGTSYYANNTSGGGKFKTGEKVKEVGIDVEPTVGSRNLVESGGVFGSLDTLLSEIYDDRYLLSVLMPYIEMGENKFIWTFEAYGNIQGDGSIEESSLYKYSKLFPIKPNTTYTKSGLSVKRVALYDVNGVFKSLITADTFTTAKDEVYMRLNSNAATPTIQSTFMLTEGSTAAEFSTPYVKIKWDILPSDLLDEVNSKFEVIFAEVYKSTSSAYTSSGYISISGEEKSGTAGRRTGYLAYSGGDVIACGRSTDTVPLMVFFSGQSSENCLGYYPNPRTIALSQRLVIAKASDIPAGTTHIRFNGNAEYTYYNNLAEMPTYATADALASEASRATAAESVLTNSMNSLQADVEDVNEKTDWAFQTTESTNIADISSRTGNNKTLSTSTGEIIDTSSLYQCTEAYIKIKPNTSYICNKVRIVCRYDENKVFIATSNLNASSGATFTTESNAVYIRYSWSVASRSYVQINEGSTLLPFEPFYAPYIDFTDDAKIVIKEVVDDVLSIYYHGPFDVKKADFCDWYAGLQGEYASSSVFGESTTYAQIIAAFDALQAEDSAYITKTALGTASGTDSGDNPYTIYEYVFKPKRYNITLNNKKVPKMMMDGSIHGFEKNSTYGLYYFLKDLVEHWNESRVLTALRSHVEIHVIPVTNPYGFDHNTYKNANNVNINRNFDHPGDWIVVPSGDDQNGLEPFDQPESAIIRDWINANKSDIICYLNLHTNGHYNASGYGEMNACMTSSDRNDSYYNRIFNVFARHIEEQTLIWPSIYDNMSPSSTQFCGKNQSSATSASTKGTASAWANTMNGLLAMTLEGFNGLVVNSEQIIGLFSADSKKVNSEIIGNMVIQMLCEFGDE